jgi:Ankyrin repeats (3 copies)
MKNLLLSTLSMMLLLSSWVQAQPTKEELTAQPQYIRNAIEPVFESPQSETVLKDIKIVYGRNTAIFGFNTPEVVVYLPRIDNSAYAIVRFDEPDLFDAKGGVVPFDLEGGGYDDDTFSTEIRVASKNGVDIVEFAKIKGIGKIKYPLKIKTLSIKKGNASDMGLDTNLDGPFVTYTDPNISEMIFLYTGIGPVRAYDASGHRLEKDGYNGTSTKGEVTRRTLAFLGQIAEVKIDVVEKWVEIEFTYELPPVKPLPESFAGSSMSRPPNIIETAGGKVQIKLIPDKQPEKDQQTKKVGDSLIALKKLNLSFHAAVSIFPEEEVLQLIADGADVNRKDDYNRTPLHLVAYRCDTVRIVQALVDAGADVNVKTVNDHTPLWFARSMNCTENEKILVKAGAK